MASDWRHTTLGTLGSFRNGVNFNRAQEGLGIPVLKVKNFDERSTVPIDGLDELTQALVTISIENYLEVGDTVIMRSNGNPALVGRSMFFAGSPRPITFSGFCIRFRPNTSRIHARFASYLIRSPFFRARFSLHGSGTGITNLSQDLLASVPVNLPSLEEQEAISCILGALDAKVELLQGANGNLELITRTAFKSWFVDFDPVRATAEGREPEGMDAPTAALFPAELAESEGLTVPSGWSVQRLLDFIEINPLRSLVKARPAPYLEMANAPTSGPRPAAWVDRLPISGCRFRNGDTLLAKITPCLENGKTAFVDFLEEGQVGWGSTEFIVLAPKAPIPATFGYLLARDINFREFAIQSMSGTSGRQRIQVDQLGKFKFPIADAPIYKAFGELINPMFAAISHNDQQAKTLAELRDSLLPRLISGKLRVPEAEELVEALL